MLRPARAKAEVAGERELQEDGELDGGFRPGRLKQANASEPPILLAINASTKWVVSGLLAVIALWYHNEAVAWCVTGSIVNSVNSKVLKRVFNHARPANARKDDPGMPSSHAQSLAFLGAYGVVSVLSYWGSSPWSSTLALLLVASATFLTWLRVRLGYHTVDQVAVGSLVGSSFAWLWFWLWRTYLQQYILEGGPFGSVSLAVYAAAAGTSFLFSLTIVSKWFSEHKRK